MSKTKRLRQQNNSAKNLVDVIVAQPNGQRRGYVLKKFLTMLADADHDAFVALHLLSDDPQFWGEQKSINQQIWSLENGK